MKGIFEKSLHRAGYAIKRVLPRPSVLFAKRKFGNKELIVVEIGTFEADNALSMLKTLNIKKIYLIDPYTKYESYKNDPAYYQVFKAEKIAEKKLNKYKDKIVWIKKFSNEAINDIPLADFIYIDGNHDYEFAKKDMENYIKKLFPDGVMAGHDIENINLEYGVTRAFVEFCSEKKFKPHIHYPDWWIVNGETISKNP
jgi:hypothetical protein